jgi:hypothetical protein
MGTDGRDLQLTHEWGNQAIPTFALGWEQEYLASGPVERVIRMVNTAFNNIFRGYDALSDEWKKKVMFIVFDEFVEGPHDLCQQLAEFLGTRTTRRTKGQLKRENCPRVIPSDQKEIRKSEFRKDASAKSMDLLETHSREYLELVRAHGK